jgi:hypothetical protein
MSCALMKLLLLLFLERNARILEFLFKGLVFLITSLGFSILLNSGGFMERILDGNVLGFSNTNLCLDISRHFLFTNRESVCGGMYCSCVSVLGKTSLVVKVVCVSDFVGMRVIFGMLVSMLFPYLSVSVLSFILFISFISLSLLSFCLGIGVLKFFFSILSICIWLNLMNARVFKVKASFADMFLKFEVCLEFEELGFLKVGEEGTGGFVIGLFFIIFFSSSSFYLTNNWIIIVFIRFSSN